MEGSVGKRASFQLDALVDAGVDAVQKHFNIVFAQVLVGCFSSPLEIAVIVNHEDAAHAELWEELDELMSRRAVEVSVEP